MSRSKNRKKKQQRANKSEVVISESAHAESPEHATEQDLAETETTLQQTSEVLRDATETMLAGAPVVAVGEVELNESPVRVTPPVVSVAQVEAAKADLNGHEDLLDDLPPDVFTPLEIDFFRRAEELYTVAAFDTWEDLDRGEEEADEPHAALHARHREA